MKVKKKIMSEINNFSVQLKIEEGLEFSINIKQGFPATKTHYGRTYAKRTEACIYLNGFITGVNFVTKHSKDRDDLKYAVVAALKPIMKKIALKWVRAELWKLVFEKIKNYG